MRLKDIDISCCDLHIHSIASDGEMSAEQIIYAASELELKSISITDHDGIGAYTTNMEKLNDLAERSGMGLLTGVEFDSEFNGTEIHILGYGINPNEKELVSYLDENHRQRNRRIIELIKEVNGYFKKEILKKDSIFTPGRETLMKPHLIKVLLKEKLFRDYPEAKKWIQTNIQLKTEIIKPSPDFIVKLIKKAGGEAVLAHPGYYIAPLGNRFNDLMGELIFSGISGIEVFYDYSKLSHDMFSLRDQEKLLEMFLNISKKNGLIPTRGSDAHSLPEFRKRNRMCGK